MSITDPNHTCNSDSPFKYPYIDVVPNIRQIEVSNKDLNLFNRLLEDFYKSTRIGDVVKNDRVLKKELADKTIAQKDLCLRCICLKATGFIVLRFSTIDNFFGTKIKINSQCPLAWNTSLKLAKAITLIGFSSRRKQCKLVSGTFKRGFKTMLEFLKVVS